MVLARRYLAICQWNMLCANSNKVIYYWLINWQVDTIQMIYEEAS